MALDPNPARKEFLTSRECSKMIGSLIGSLVGVLELKELRSVVLLATAIAGHARIDIAGKPAAVCFDDEGRRFDLPDTGPTMSDGVVVAIRALGGLAASLSEMAPSDACRVAWRWWCLKEEPWEWLAKLGQPGSSSEMLAELAILSTLRRGNN